MTKDTTGRRFDRRTVLKSTGAGATAALAGCQTLLGGDDGNGNGGNGNGGNGNSVGNGGNGDGQIPDDPALLGLLTFTEGAAGVLGIQAQRGAELAVQRINDAGGIAGEREVELDVSDEGDQALQRYRTFIDDGAEATFGPISSGTHEEITLEIEDSEVINIATDGTVTTLYEETNPDPTYSFRFQNYDVMECVTMAREAVERLGPDSIDTIAGINPDYTFGHDEMDVFTSAMQQLTDAEVVYEGLPSLGEGDMSTQVSEVINNEPDVLFSSLWGGDVTTLLEEADAQGMHDSTTLFGTVLYSAADDVSSGAVDGKEIYSGSRNFYWDAPPVSEWGPGQELLDAAQDQEGITVPTAHYMSGYGAVATWAQAVEKAIDIVGGWPSQDQIVSVLEGSGTRTPAGYHYMPTDHTARSNSFAGQMVWDGDLGAARLEDVNTYPANAVSPAPGDTASDWIENWG